LRRKIQKYLEDPISDIILKKPPENGTLISVKYQKNKLCINLLQPKVAR
jgi:ATP-dependent Clp protease ATP-binding subunit ClpA